jgi:hypothetical protein
MPAVRFPATPDACSCLKHNSVRPAPVQLRKAVATHAVLSQPVRPATPKYKQMKTHKPIHTSAHQGASETSTNTLAAEVRQDTNSPTIPARKDRKKMERRIWRRLRNEVGVGLFYDILTATAEAMLDDLERGKNRDGSLIESDLFAVDGSLTERGDGYLNETFESVISDFDCLTANIEIRGNLARVLDKECLAFFRIGRAIQSAKLKRKHCLHARRQ